MKIDFRKSRQYFKNTNGLNDVYVYRNTPLKGIHQTGINGTSYHYQTTDRNHLKELVQMLINIK